MGFVGGLIFPQVAVLRRLDTDATRSGGGYDADFREVTVADTDADGTGESKRVEKSEIRVPAQFATRRFEALFQAPHGRVPETFNFELTFHFRDLTRLGLVAPDGQSRLVPGDRLVKIEDRSGNTMHEFPDPPGMYFVSARPSGFLGAQRNLLVCTFADRRQATERVVTGPQV